MNVKLVMPGGMVNESWHNCNGMLPLNLLYVNFNARIIKFCKFSPIHVGTLPNGLFSPRSKNTKAVQFCNDKGSSPTRFHEWEIVPKNELAARANILKLAEKPGRGLLKLLELKSSSESWSCKDKFGTYPWVIGRQIHILYPRGQPKVSGIGLQDYSLRDQGSERSQFRLHPGSELNKRNCTRLGSKFTASSQFSALLRPTPPKSRTFEEERPQIQLRFSAFKEKLFPLKFRTSKCEREGFELLIKPSLILEELLAHYPYMVQHEVKAIPCSEADKIKYLLPFIIMHMIAIPFYKIAELKTFTLKLKVLSFFLLCKVYRSQIFDVIGVQDKDSYSYLSYFGIV
ncbi:hypothetical protein CFP56_036813 [Quercus suber]|uniref:Uncharacterized protein n=1 Tax=Quercus suber TaxID=58331 RepID=A0AAW0MCS5_QUESU